MTEFASKKLSPSPVIPTNGAPIIQEGGALQVSQSFFTSTIQKTSQFLHFLNDERLDFETYGRSSSTKRWCIGIGLFLLACLVIYALIKGILSLTGNNEKKRLKQQ